MTWNPSENKASDKETQQIVDTFLHEKKWDEWLVLRCFKLFSIYLRLEQKLHVWYPLYREYILDLLLFAMGWRWEIVKELKSV